MKQLAQRQAASTVPVLTRTRTGTKQISSTVTGLSRIMDGIAGWCFAGIMMLVVANVLLRTLFNRPILGTYEYAGFLTAAAIGLALAHCAIRKGHIAVTIVTDRLPAGVQAAIQILIHTAAAGFWDLVAWQTLQYGSNMAATGLVSSTTQTPVHPFVYLVSAGIFVLCLVEFIGLLDTIKKAAFDK